MGRRNGVDITFNKVTCRHTNVTELDSEPTIGR